MANSVFSGISVGTGDRANGYGQNGYPGPSSDVPGEKPTTSGFLPQVAVPNSDWQTRKVSAEQYPASHGMTKPDSKGSIPSTLTVRTSAPKTNRSFQR